jgi:hypothetical protein
VALNAATPQTSAAVAATMGKARLAGVDKQVVEMTVKKGLVDFYGSSDS